MPFSASALLACLLAVALTACEPPLVPDYVTPAGMQVFVADGAQAFDPEELDAVVEATLASFADSWDLPSDARAVPLPVLSVLNADSYALAGQKVAGNLSEDGRWMFVGAQTRPLHDTALVHELIHYFDLVAHGITDGTHASWKGQVYDRLTEINGRISRGELKRGRHPPAG